MADETLDRAAAQAQIDARIKHFGSKAAYARHLGMTPQQLGRSLGADVTPDGKVLADLGLIKKTVFCKKGTANDG